MRIKSRHDEGQRGIEILGRLVSFLRYVRGDAGRDILVELPRRAIQLSVLISFFLILFFLAGCCTYQGKAVSKRDAEAMKALGMEVQCH
jgi:hypothetical protein